MCIAPNKLDNGIEIRCSQCWQCHARKINDWVGRCIAESKYSTKTYAVTLTYDDKKLDKGEETHSVILIYKDVQDFLKRLRKKYKVRYIVTGEYGSAKGRAHWHIILFFKGDYPEMQENNRVNWKFWKNGFSYFQYPDWKGFQYCLKYILKDQNSLQADTHLAMSKKPPLGYQFFNDLAHKYVDQALAPQTYYYKFGDIRDTKNREKRFLMTGKTKENFMSNFMTEWESKYDHEPISEIVSDYLDDITELEYTDEEMYERIHYKPVKYVEPWTEVQGDGIFTKDHLIQATYDGIPICYWENEDSTKLHIITENDEWHEERPEVIKTIKQGQQQISRQSHAENLYETMFEEE